jgi:hypothetical protein
VRGTLAAIAGIVAVAIAIRSPFNAFCVLIASLPFESALAIKGPVTITPGYLALILTAAVSFAHTRRQADFSSLSSPLNIFVLAYLCLTTASLVMTVVVPPPAPVATTELLRWRAGEYRSVVQIVFLFFSSSAYFATIYSCSNAVRVRIATRAYICAGGLTALYAVYQTVGVRYHLPLVGPYTASLFDTPASLRPNATFQEPSNFAHYLVGVFPVSLSLYLHRSKLLPSDRGVYSAAGIPLLGCMAIALLLTIGRGAWLGFAVACPVVFAAGNREVRRQGLALAALSAVAAIPVLIFAFGSLPVAFTTVANRFGGGLRSEQRLWYFPFLIGLFRTYPILGVGYGNYPLYQVFGFNLGGIAGAYGVFWQSLVETGVVGFGALVALVGAAIVAIVRALRVDGVWRPYLVGWLGSIVGLMVPYLFFGDRFSLYVWVTLGLAMSTVRLARAQRSLA